MAEAKQMGVPFPISLVTDPAQPGLTDFTVFRYDITESEDLTPPVDITGIAIVDEFVEDVVTYVETITVAAARLRGHDKIMVTGDTSGEIQVGHTIAIHGHGYTVTHKEAGTGGADYLTLALPLRTAVAEGDAVSRSGNTGKYRIIVREDNERTVQYSISSASSLPEINRMTAVVDIEDPSSGGEAVVDNSKLLL